MGIINVENVKIEDLLEWFYYSVVSASGDGSAVICCDNPKETSEYFIKWWQNKMSPDKLDNENFWHPKEESYGPNGRIVVNYHDNNENFMFCNYIINIGVDNAFIIESDCKSCDGKFTCVPVRR